MPDYEQIKAEYIQGCGSLRALAKKHGVSPSILMTKSAKEKWADLKGKAESKARSKQEQKMISVAVDQKTKAEIKINTIADILLEKIEDGLRNETLVLSGRGLRDITGALKDIRDIKGYKTELDMQEQMARIEKLRKDAQEETTDTSIEVKMEGGLEDYAG